MTDNIDDMKKMIADYQRKVDMDIARKRIGKTKKDAVKEPYGEELEPDYDDDDDEPVRKPVKKPKKKDPDLERFSGDEVNLTQEEFNALMKHAEIGQQFIQGGVPARANPPRIVAPMQDDVDQPSQIVQVKPRSNTVQIAEEQVLPDEYFLPDEPPKKKGFLKNRFGGSGESYVEEDKVSGRPTILYFDTDNTCKLITGKLKNDGSLQIDDRIFDFTQGQPSILTIKGGKGRSSSYPFYVLRYDNMVPIDVNEYPESNPTPEQASRLVELKTLETLSRIEGGKLKKGPIIILMLASFFGGFVMKLLMGMLGIW